MHRLLPAFAAACAAGALLWTLPATALTSTATGAPGQAAATAVQPTVTGLRYVLGPADAAALTAIQLDLAPADATAQAAAPAPAALRVRLRPGGAWYRCDTVAGGSHAVCPTPGETVAGVTGVDVAAAR